MCFLTEGDSDKISRRAAIWKGDMLEIQFALPRFQAIKRTEKVRELQKRKVSANLELSAEIMSLRQ